MEGQKDSNNRWMALEEQSMLVAFLTWVLKGQNSLGVTVDWEKEEPR